MAAIASGGRLAAAGDVAAGDEVARPVGEGLTVAGAPGWAEHAARTATSNATKLRMSY